MSLPTTKPAQLSIRSFFQAKTPKYAPPPSSKLANPLPTTTTPVATAPPPTSTAALATPPPPAAAAGNPPVQSQEPEINNAPPPPPPSSNSAAGYAIRPLPANLPREACIRPVSSSDVNALRRINALLLPVSYPDSFYQRAVEPANSGPFSRVITWAHDGAEPKVVGGVVCRIEPALMNGSSSSLNDDGVVGQNLYIQSLCLLSPYRSLGLVNAALDNIVATAVANPEFNVTNVTAHVWTENEEGLKWYEGRGFKRDEPAINGYYMKLRPSSAWLVSRPVSAAVRNSLPSNIAASAPPPRSVPQSTTAAIVNLPPMSGPPRGPNAPPLPRTSSGQSYQNQRAETEWNDLPNDMSSGRKQSQTNLLIPTSTSATSSRSSSAARKKRDRSYPAAAFGN